MVAVAKDLELSVICFYFNFVRLVDVCVILC